MRRLRWALVLAACAVLVGGLAVLAVADPFHLRHARWFTAGLVLVVLLLLTGAFAVLVRRGVPRVLVLVVGGIAVFGWVAVVALAAQVSVENRTVIEVAEGGKRLVVVEGEPAQIPIYAVVLRSGGGAFEQETVVYQGVEAGPMPALVRFVDPHTVEVRTLGGCVYRSEVEAVTLEVDPVHRPLRPDGC